MRANAVYRVTTDQQRNFWAIAGSPGRAISKLKRRRLLDRGEHITGAIEVGTIDVF